MQIKFVVVVVVFLLDMAIKVTCRVEDHLAKQLLVDPERLAWRQVFHKVV